MGRSGNGAFPGAAWLLVSSFLSYPLPDDGRLATGRNSPSGLSQEAEQSRASSDTRRPCIIILAARKDGHPRRVRTRWQCGSQQRMTAGTDRPGKHGTAHWRGRPLGQFGDKARFNSAPFQEDGSLVGPRQREREKDRFDPCPSSPYSLFTIHYLPARRERDPGKLHRKGRKSHGTKQDKYSANGPGRYPGKG